MSSTEPTTDNATAGRGNYATGIATRDGIVRAARQVLVERGFYGMTLASVADRSGVTASGLTHHFPSKEHLLLALMEDRFNTNWDWLQAQTNQGSDILEGHVALISRYIKAPVEASLQVVLTSSSIDPSHPAHRWCTERYDFLRTSIAAQVREDQAAGIILPELDSEVIAIQMIAMTEGLLINWLHDPEQFDPVTVMKSITDTLRVR